MEHGIVVAPFSLTEIIVNLWAAVTYKEWKESLLKLEPILMMACGSEAFDDVLFLFQIAGERMDMAFDEEVKREA